MAVVRVDKTPVFMGLSTDTKPVGVPVGSKFLETNTGNVFIFDGSDWKDLSSGNVTVII